MQRVAIILLMILLPLPGPLRGAESDGFRGLGWGTEFSAMSGMERIPDTRGSTRSAESYRKKGDDLNVSDAMVDNIAYNFMNGRLYSVAIDFRNYTNLEKLQNYCTSRFGANRTFMGKETEAYISYDSPGTGALLYYQFTRQGEQRYDVRYGRLFLYSREMDARMNKSAPQHH